MRKEIYKEKEEEFKELAPILAKTFIQRWDLYARQLADGSYICIKEPLKFDHLNDHLCGKITLGAHVLDQKSHAKYIVFDADNEIYREYLSDLAIFLKIIAVPSYLEDSARGGHLWLFFSQPISGKKARLFGQGLARISNLTNVELFPKQDKLRHGPGSLIRMPFGVHRKTGGRYGFVNPSNQPLANSIFDQIQILCRPETVPVAFLEAMLNKTSNRRKATVRKGLDEPKKPLSVQIKDSISVYDFVGQYVELSPNGQGLCPFHDDQHASFSVDIEKNYWHCFAGCGGGSIIDFWMEWQDIDFKLAIKEMAERLL